jgi:hypothetical protein
MKKKIIAFDIGIKNFSYAICDIDIENINCFDIKSFDCVNLIGENQKVDKFVLNKSFFFHFHHVFLPSIHQLIKNCNVCLIEKQLQKRNIKANIVYDHLIAHLMIHFPSLQVIPFPPKLKYYFSTYSKCEYKDRKQWSIDFVSSKMKQDQDELILELFYMFAKKDDIADCLLMIFSYVNQKQIQNKKNK